MTPKVIQPPDPDRRQTRPGNANAHPGKIVMEASVRRKQEVIDEEKEERSKRRESREKISANKKTAVIDIADFENEMALNDMEMEAQFPRRQSKGMYSLGP